MTQISLLGKQSMQVPHYTSGVVFALGLCAMKKRRASVLEEMSMFVTVALSQTSGPVFTNHFMLALRVLLNSRKSF